MNAKGHLGHTILNLLDNDLATDWLVKHFHPDGLKCPHCAARVDQARSFA